MKPVVEEQSWGELVWYAGGPTGVSTSLTLGRCTIRPNQQNPRHAHTVCEEVLTVVSGTIVHTLGDGEVTMTAGDTIAIPAGVFHNARNVGDGDAVMTIAYPTATRDFVAE
jgi:quercetin dioxygenase-like cupin family protein